MTQSDRWKQRPAVLRYRAYCDGLRLRLPGYTLPKELWVEFGVPMPASWSNRKRQSLQGQPHSGKPDIDNLAKAFMDAFKDDDSHVYRLEASKYWSETGYVKTLQVL